MSSGARYEIIDCVQGSPEWFEAKRGLPSSSRFKDILAQGKGIMRYTYMKQLAGEIITGVSMKTYTNEKMERGTEQEPDLRNRYAFERDVDIVQVGFIKMNPKLCVCGCSPDGLVGDDGMVELKSAEPTVLIDILRGGKPPPEHLPQVMGGLWITGRRWCDLVIGWPKMPMARFRIDRDDAYIANISAEVKRFNADLKVLVEELETK